MNWINHTLSALHLSKTGLDTRISQYYEYCWVRHRDFASHQLLGSLPAVFSKRVALQAHATMLRQFPPFAEAEERFLAELAVRPAPSQGSSSAPSQGSSSASSQGSSSAPSHGSVRTLPRLRLRPRRIRQRPPL